MYQHGTHAWLRINAVEKLCKIIWLTIHTAINLKHCYGPDLRDFAVILRAGFCHIRLTVRPIVSTAVFYLRAMYRWQ